MTKILVFYDKWITKNTKNIWRTSFKEALGCESSEYEFICIENIEGSYKWSTKSVDHVKEVFGNPDEIMKSIKDCEARARISGYAPFLVI